MNTPSVKSPSYRNIISKHKHSPIELKEKMRKNYKDKVQNCRNMLFNRFRGTVEERDLRNKLTEIYKSMFNFSDIHMITDEENEIMEEIKNELVQEELGWWLQEHEKSQTDNVDWSSLEQEDVICPICQKVNLSLESGSLSCSHCVINIPTQKTLLDVKRSLESCLEKHSVTCNNIVQFNVVPENNESHIYLICGSCLEMALAI